MVQLSAIIEQTRETQLAHLYDVLVFRRVKTGTWMLSMFVDAPGKFSHNIDICNVYTVYRLHSTWLGDWRTNGKMAA